MGASVRLMDRPGSPYPPAPAAIVAARLALIVLSLALAAVAGCGGSGSKPAADAAPATPAPETSAPATPAPATPAPVTRDSVATPVVSSPAGLGASVFAKRCALCHGAEGRGDGLASKGLNPKPRNFHDAAYMKTRTDAQLLEVIHQGKGAMPKWGGQLSEAEITAVLAHIRELGKKD